MKRQVLVLVSLSMLLMTTCASLKFYPNEDKVVDPRTKGERSFNPLGFQDDKKIITQKEHQENWEVEGEDTGQIHLNRDSSGEAEYEYKTIYRVQVFTSEILSEATLLADSIKPAVAPEKVYLEYQSPYYRVRVGDYSSFEEAEELMRKLIEIGLGQAWVVKSSVKIEKNRD